ncbi:hemerythrin domain-containing protein [Methylobacterium sp. CM6257]
MNVWQLIARDHAFLAHLIAEIRYAAGTLSNRDREEVLGGLIDELAAHAEALEASLYMPLRQLDRTRQLAEDLHHEHARFIGQLDTLAWLRRGGSGRWRGAALDITLIGEHLRCYTQELIPAARDLLSPAQVDAAAHAFIRAKLRTLRARQHRGSGRLTLSGFALACAGAAGLGYLAGRSGRRKQTKLGPSPPPLS